jgi:predicted dehydrogenase
MSESNRKHPIAIIGCGAIVESFYVPAFKAQSNPPELVFIDANAGRAQRMAALAGAPHWGTDYRAVLDGVGGAIVAVPPSAHHDIALACLERRVHVLCEKPLAPSLGDAEELVAAATRHGVTLGVNNGRRLFPAFQEVHRLVQSGELGTLRTIELELGEAFDWPAASASYFGIAAGGRGVLLDIGAHILDLACWWLGAKPTLVRYGDDSLGGTEAYATLEFAHRDCRGRITLSWLSRLANRFVVRGDRATLAGQMYDWRDLTMTTNGRSRRIQVPTAARSMAQAANAIVDNFVQVVDGASAPLVSADSVLPSIALIEECYAQRQRLPLPWYDAMERILDAR